jgi:hypothetical protein
MFIQQETETEKPRLYQDQLEIRKQNFIFLNLRKLAFSVLNSGYINRLTIQKRNQWLQYNKNTCSFGFLYY